MGTVQSMSRPFISRRAAPAALFAVLVIGPWLLSARSLGVERVSKEEGLAAFETVRVVLQHPRCQNCHIPGDAPLQFDDGRVHAQNVVRGQRGTGVPGLPCSTCHGMANPPASWGAHMPPGSPNWHLPAPDHKMVFIGLSSGELCRHLKEKSSTGGRDLEALLRHVTADRIVLWGWNPGVGRNPVSVPHDEFVAKFKQWMAAGAPCAPE
jgi:hypothetical protein